MNVLAGSLAVATALLVSATAVPTAADDGDARRALAARGVEAYERALGQPEGEPRRAAFREAQRAFASAAAAGAHNAALYTNLGNAALQAESPGSAVLAYRRALALDPASTTARQNLAHVRGLLPGWVPRPSEARGLVDGVTAWHTRTTRLARVRASALAFALAGALLAAGVRWRRPWLRQLAWLPGAVWLALISSLTANALAPEPAAAVLTAPETLARSADSPHAAPRFPKPLPAGTEVQILEERTGWIQIRLADARSAWVPAASLTRVEDPAATAAW